MADTNVDKNNAQLAPAKWIRAPGRALLIAIVCAMSVALFFRYQIANGFTVLFTNRYDGMIVVAIQEHWYNVFRGFSHWSQANFWYPVPNTLGYQDGYLVNGVFYAGFRAFGVDPFLASEIVNMTLRALGFFGAYLALRRVFGVEFLWAILGSILFTLSSSSFNHTGHVQLLTISFAPYMTVLLHGAFGALLSGRRRALLIWGMGAASLYALWLMSGYYMAWYFLYFMAAMLIIAPLLMDREDRSALMLAMRRQAFPLVGLVVLFVALNLPFLNLYLSKIAESGEQKYQLALSMSPSLLDIPNVSSVNLLYGRIVVALHDLVAPSLPLFGERTTGVSVILLFLFGCAAASLWRCRERTGTALLSKAVAAAVLLTWITVVHVGNFSLWYMIYHLVPGAKAMRATGRYQIFLAAPIIALAIRYLSWNAQRIAVPVLLLVCVLLVVEQLGDSSPVQLDRRVELARLTSVPPPPPACKVFFASAARPAVVQNKFIEDVYSHNVDAMLVAEYLHLPTINGMGAILPPGWALFAPEDPSYLRAVALYVAAHQVKNLCALDLRTMRWDTEPRLPPLHAG